MSEPTPTIRIDGSLGEGGGQVMRIALGISALYGLPVEIDNIRANRSKPGLQTQHLKGVELVAAMCDARLTGAHLGSTSVTFHPGPLRCERQNYLVDTLTAGCVCLLVQISLPCALFAARPTTCIFKGGTNVPFGPQVEYFKNVFRPMLQLFGASFELEVPRKGYYPRGGGEIRMQVNPVSELKSIELLNAGTPRHVKGWSYVAGAVNIGEAQRMANDARFTIMRELSKRGVSAPKIDITAYREPSHVAIGHGSGINLACWTSTNCIFGGSGLGAKHPPPVPPGVMAANDLVVPILIDSCVDKHLQDQLILFMALAKGTSRVKVGQNELTSHTQTAIQVAEIMLGSRGLSFNLSRDDNESYILECKGIGLTNEFLH